MRTSERLACSGLAALVAVGCASGGVTADRPTDESIDTQLAQVAGFRTGNHRDAALAALDRVLRHVNQQGGPQALPPTTRAALDTEIRGAADTVRASVDGPLAAGHPLAGEAALGRLSPLLTDAALAPARQAGADAIKKTGQEACVRLQASVTPEAPYWGLGVSRYCAHFGTTFAAPPRPIALGSFEVIGALSGLNAAQAAHLRDSVTRWLRASLWFDPEGKAVGHGTIGGSYVATIKRQTVTLHAPYKETITISSGLNIVPPLAPVPGQTVVREPPPSSPSWTTVDQTFAYDTEETRGDYTLSASLKVDIGDATPVTLDIRRAQGIKGYAHDVTFEPAGIAPQHDEAPSSQQWFRSQVDSMWGKAVWALNRKFISAYCKRESFSPDDAVRCVAVGQQPPGVMAALAQAIGEDAGPLVPLLQPPPQPKEEAPVKRPARAAPRKGTTGAVDDEDPVID